MITKQLTLITFLVALVYTVVRYGYFKGVSVADFPLYLMNKATAISGLLLFGLAGLQANSTKRLHTGLSALALIFIHVMSPLVLLSEDYFEVFYDSVNKQMAWNTQISMLSGILAFTCVLILLRATDNGKSDHAFSLVPGLGRWGLVLVFLHMVFMATDHWITPQQWPGNMPPITLISALICIIFCLLHLEEIKGACLEPRCHTLFHWNTTSTMTDHTRTSPVPTPFPR